MSDHKITLDDAEVLLRSRMGLIFGPGITVGGDFFGKLARDLTVKWGGQYGQRYTQSGQQALANDVDASEIKKAIHSSLKSEASFPHLGRIANLKWSAALSFSLDSHFERELRRACERKPSGFTATQVNDFPQVVPLKTVPVFKLLGALDGSDFVFSEIAYVARRPRWRYAVQEFADKVKSNPVVCLGLVGCSWLLLDLLSQILSEPKTILSPLLFVESEFEPNTRNDVIALTQNRIQVAFIDTPLTDLVSRTKDVENAGTTLPLVFRQPPSEFDHFVPFQDIVAPVNAQLTSQIGREETARLVDLLFSPTLPRWDPFYHNLDFRRSIGTRMLDSLLRLAVTGRNLPAFALVGSAASGKTTVAKRVAYDLAARGHAVFWFRRAFYPNVQGILSDFFRILAKVVDKRKRIFFFIDDPLGLGSINIEGIASNPQALGLKCTFVIVARSSDWIIHRPHEIIGALELVEDVKLEDEFDRQEMEALPNYLVALNIFPDKETARREIAAAPSCTTSDTLGLLYWLLPKTRQSIEASIQEEYFRLGERAGLSRVIVGTYSKTTDTLREAYAMVAVSDHYHTPVPMEVLVSALDVHYRAWIESVGTEGPAWGLLYGEPSPDGETTLYRPRNSIVTRILVETLNGGRLAHGGEVEKLLRLLRSCTGTVPIYREFCINILVPRSKLSHLEYADGLQLYDAAISALPFDDRTLKHQKGLWIKDKGNDPLFAKEVLESSLTASVYPYTSRGEAEEHIHTSIAATILDATDKGERELSIAIPEILQHLDRARSDSFFNPRAVHVQANLMLRLVSKLQEQDSADTFQLLNQALIDVDSALLVLKNPLRDRRDRRTKDIDFLEDISGRIYGKILPLDDLTESALDLWQRFKRQEGFVIAGRKLYHIAREKNSGSAYKEAFTYCREAIARVQTESQAPSPDLCAISVCIYYEWNINRYDAKATNRKIDWAMLYDLAHAVIQSPKYAGDQFYKFVSAVALVQQGRWSDAKLLFAQIRKAGIPSEQLYDARAVLLDDGGIRMRVQGTITGEGERKYLKVDELRTDFYVSRDEHWPNPGEIAHAYVGFAFAGPLAIQNLS